jgi:hypothetical protein
LSALPPGGERRLDGNALLAARRSELAKLRGAACGERLTAGVPAGGGEETYSAPARAVLAVSRDSLGVPGSRWPGSQARLGVPVAAATPWDQIAVGGDGASQVWEQMDREAAQGAGILPADPAVRRLAWLSETRALGPAAQAQGLAPPQERPGMHPTAVAGQGGEPTRPAV